MVQHFPETVNWESRRHSDTVIVLDPHHDLFCIQYLSREILGTHRIHFGEFLVLFGSKMRSIMPRSVKCGSLSRRIVVNSVLHGDYVEVTNSGNKPTTPINPSKIITTRTP